MNKFPLQVFASLTSAVDDRCESFSVQGVFVEMFITDLHCLKVIFHLRVTRLFDAGFLMYFKTVLHYSMLRHEFCFLPGLKFLKYAESVLFASAVCFVINVFCWRSSRLDTERPAHLPAPGTEAGVGVGGQPPGSAELGRRAGHVQQKRSMKWEDYYPRKAFLELGDAYLGQRLSPQLKFLSVARHWVRWQMRSSFYCKTLCCDRRSHLLWWAFCNVCDCQITTLYTWKRILYVNHTSIKTKEKL